MEATRTGSAVESAAARHGASRPASGRSRAADDGSFAPLIAELARRTADLVRDEIALARREITDAVAGLRKGLVLMLAAVALAPAAFLFLALAARDALAERLAPWLSSLAVGLVLTIGAAIVAWMGLRRLRAQRLKPRRAIETLRETTDWLKGSR